MQTLIVLLMVLVCSVYATWSLMPTALRRTIARSLLRHSLPEPLARRMRRAAAAPAGCGCEGCDHAPAKAATTQIVSFHPRARR
jgi:hypothetical protein